MGGPRISRLRDLLPSQWKCGILLLVAQMCGMAVPDYIENEEGRTTWDAGPDGSENA
jgi:hypothetical protein